MIPDKDESTKVADEFMRIAKSQGHEAAAGYLGRQRSWIGMMAVAIVLARLAESK